MDVALTSLEASIHTSGPKGERAIRISDFYRVPGNTPNIENVLAPGELITHVTVPKLPAGTRSYYLKRRDRASYEFALASAAVVAQMEGGRFRHIRIAFGGIGTKPWRSLEAEQALTGKEATEENFRVAAEAALKSARPLHDNAFKVELAKRTLVRALKTVTQSA
jgi:xanthine dehydrogenase YagS FAD-binding subunit